MNQKFFSADFIYMGTILVNIFHVFIYYLILKYKYIQGIPHTGCVVGAWGYRGEERHAVSFILMKGQDDKRE